MTDTAKKPARKPPEISPYLLTWVLAGFGLWCLYDGFLTTDANMQKYLWFNRGMGILLTTAAVWDYLRMRKKIALKAKNSGNSPTGLTG
jgi:hypothetical protein